MTLVKRTVKTKAQREAEQKAALLRRVTDVYCGAKGDSWDHGDEWATAQILENVVWALKKLFGPQLPDYESPWMPHCLSHFDTPESATDFLFDNGFRA
jgi:hypothetical protein